MLYQTGQTPAQLFNLLLFYKRVFEVIQKIALRQKKKTIFRILLELLSVQMVFQERKSSPNRTFLGGTSGRTFRQISGWTSRRISGRTSRAKSFLPIARSARNWNLWCERPSPEGADVRDPRGSQRDFKQEILVREAPDTSNFLRHLMRAIWSVRPKCSHRCVSLKETSLKRVEILKHITFYSAEQTAMRTKWFRHIAI